MTNADFNERKSPKTQTEFSGGGIGKPPKPTAVGTGGSDDDELKRSTIRDSVIRLDRTLDAQSIGSWAIPNLSFVKLSLDNQVCVGANQAEALRNLHGRYANLAFLELGNQSGRECFFGMSLPASIDPVDESFLYREASLSDFERAGFAMAERGDLVKREDISSKMSKICFWGGCLTGVPARKGTIEATMNSRYIESVRQSLSGKEFGLLVLAVPVPSARLALEETAISKLVDEFDCKQAQKFDPMKFQRLQSARRIQQRIQSGGVDGFWQTAVYYFASSSEASQRLQHAIRVTYEDISFHSQLEFYPMDNLEWHVERLGMMLYRISNEKLPTLDSYKFLTALDSAALSNYFEAGTRI